MMGSKFRVVNFGDLIFQDVNFLDRLFPAIR